MAFFRAAPRSSLAAPAWSWRGLCSRSAAATMQGRKPSAPTNLFSELKAELEVARAREFIESLTSTELTPPSASESIRSDAGLTKREVEVLRLLGAGLSNQAIAEQLFVSEHTIHRHVANIFSKLSVSSRAAAVAQAARRGLL